jgi:hypothetical protein
VAFRPRSDFPDGDAEIWSSQQNSIRIALILPTLVESRRLHPRRFVAGDSLTRRQDGRVFSFYQRAGMVALRGPDQIAAGAVQFRRRGITRWISDLVR